MSYFENNKWGWSIWWTECPRGDKGKIHSLSTKLFAKWNFNSPDWGVEVKDGEFKFFTI